MRPARSFLFVLLASASAVLLLGCGDDDAGAVRSDIEQQADEAQGQLDDLQEEVEQELDEAGEDIDAGTARAHAEVFRQRLTDLGQDDSPSLAVSDLEDIASELPGDPQVSGIDDADGDGDDDDGKVQITVDQSSACVTVSGADVDVTDGEC
jgi:acetyl-CoA carboxylase carboxyltransferase component